MIVQRYILRELLINLFSIFILISVISLIVITFQSFKSFQFVSLDFFVRHTPVLFLYILPHSLIISIVFAATLAYARLSADNEIDVMRLSGLRLFKILSPALLVGLICSFIHFYSVSQIGPQVMVKRKTAERDLEAMTLKHMPPGKQVFALANGRYKLSYTNHQDGTLDTPILIISERIRDQLYDIERYIATKATITLNKDYKHTITLTDCTLQRYIRAPENPAVIKKIEEARLDQTPPIILDLGSSTELNRPKYLTTEELGLAVEFAQDGYFKRGALLEYHKRYSTIFYCLLLAVTGASIGILTRRSSKLAGLGIGLPLLIIYFVMTIFCEGLGVGGRIHPIVAAYIPAIFFGLVTIFFLWLVS